jgi:quinol monooxygenase YgiN
VSYGYQNTMRAKPGHRDEVVAVLLGGQSELADIGCRSYLVGVNDAEPDLIYVTEVWDSKQAHDDSLALPSVKAAIAAALPMLTGEFSTAEFTIRGGLGAPSS